MYSVDAYLKDAAALLARIPRQPMAATVALLRQARAAGQQIFIFGNGGSAANASHFMVDILKGALAEGKPRFRIICLNDSIPTLTAVANDMGYEHVFSEPLASLARPGDIAIAISGSGNSPNVLKAMQTARANQLVTVGLSGETGGKLRELLDIAILVPSPNMQLIEDAHRLILHAIFVELCD